MIVVEADIISGLDLASTYFLLIEILMITRLQLPAFCFLYTCVIVIIPFSSKDLMYLTVLNLWFVSRCRYEELLSCKLTLENNILAPLFQHFCIHFEEMGFVLSFKGYPSLDKKNIKAHHLGLHHQDPQSRYSLVVEAEQLQSSISLDCTTLSTLFS